MLLVLGKSQIHSVTLASWYDYIENIVIRFKTSWITVLKVAVDIYQGKLLGLAKLPRRKDDRRIAMREYLRRLGYRSVHEAVKSD